MEDAAAGSAARRQRDWTSLPAGVLQLIFSRASTWQAPGPCLVAAVCRVWGEAASGCKGIRLLYHAGHPATDSCFTSWLGQNSHRLDALTLSVSRDKISKWAFQHGTVPYNADTVLVPLAAAAEDAANGGHPLPLHTLRVLGPGPSLGTIERLMGNLLNLRCLQLTGLDHSRGLDTPMLGAAPTPRSWLIAQHLGRLSAATQLEELHLKGLLSQPGDSEHMAKMLPPGLKRLSWQGWMYTPLPDLSHLTQLTSLQLVRWAPLDHATAKLPPSLQQLELRYMGASLQVLAAQQQVLTGCHVDAASLPAPTPPPRQQQQHQEQQEQQAQQQQQQQQVTVHLPQVTAASVPDEQMNLPAVCAALGRLSNLSTLRMAPGSGDDDDDYI
jgi:hypothetical protein